MKFSDGVEGVPETRYLDDAHRPSSDDLGFILSAAWWNLIVFTAAEALKQNLWTDEQSLC